MGRGQGGCERRIEVFVNIQIKIFAGVGNKELKFLWGGGGGTKN